MIKKLIISGIGMICLAFGLNIILLVNLGASPFDTLTYDVIQLFNINKFGNAAMVLHSIVLLILIILFIKYKKNLTPLLISLISVFITTRFINIFSFVLDWNYTFNIYVMFIIGFLLYTFGIYLMSKSNIIITPSDKFSVELASIINKAIGNVRIGFDTTLFILSVLITIMFSFTVPYNIGTVIITFGTGISINMYDKILDNILK